MMKFGLYAILLVSLLMVSGCRPWGNRDVWIDEPEVIQPIDEPTETPNEDDRNQPAAENNPRVVVVTDMGDIELELFKKKAPISVSNFLKYVEAKHYDGLIFHRVMQRFMIQAGGYDVKLNERKTRDAIVNESDNGLKNRKYTLAMARTSKPDSASSQFFINTSDNHALDFRSYMKGARGYCVFGKVVRGFETVDKIAAVKCKPSTLNPAELSEPIKPVKIISIRKKK